MLKSLLIAVVVFSSLPITLFRVHIGVLTWSWLGYMNPHRLTYGFAYSFPWSQLVALATLIGLLFSKEPKRFPLNAVSIVWILLLLWFVVTTIFALYPDDAQEQLSKIIKIQLITFITVLVMTSRERVDLLIWVIVLSLGYYTVKGGVFTVMTGGSFRVWGPSGSFIEDNNHLACATLMLLPLMRYLMTITSNRWIRRALLFSILSSAASAAGSHSRGALLAGLCMSLFLLMKSKQKLRVGVALLIFLPALGVFMPRHYWERMATIFQEDEETGQREGSAQGRLDVWQLTFYLANDRLLGGGLNIWGHQELAERYPPEGDEIRAAHSIYFAVLGEHGWVGLGLFLLLWFNTWRMCNWIIRQARGIEELAWADSLARNIQISLVAYGSGGAFLSLAYFDLPYHLMAIVVIAQDLVRRHVEALSHASTGAPRHQSTAAPVAEPVPAAQRGEPRLTDPRPSRRHPSLGRGGERPTRPPQPTGASRPTPGEAAAASQPGGQPPAAPRRSPATGEAFSSQRRFQGSGLMGRKPQSDKSS